MRRAGILVAIAAAFVGLVSGCGSSSSGTAAEREAERAAAAYAEAIWHLDFHEACALEFTNRRVPAHSGKSEADKKRECEVGWSRKHPLRPGAPGPAELGEVKHLFGSDPAVPLRATISGDTAVVMLRDPNGGDPRPFRMREEGSRWLVYEEDISEEISA